MSAEDDLDVFIRARSERPRWVPVPEDRRPASERAGYRLQHAIHDELARRGIRRAGYKVGCTSVEGQRGFGLDEPIYAGIFDASRANTLREALSTPLLAPMVECEIAFTLAADIDGARDWTDTEILQAIASVHLACEVVDNRYGTDPIEIGAPTLLTDDFLHARFVLGPANPDWQTLPLESLPGFIEIDGAVVRGSTADVVTPLNSLRWLARKLASNGHALKAGEIVLSGSLVKPTPIALPARSITISVEGFGALSLAD